MSTVSAYRAQWSIYMQRTAEGESFTFGIRKTKAKETNLLKQTDKMMTSVTTTLLLAIVATCVSAAPTEKKTLFNELFDELNTTMKELSKHSMDDIFVSDLKHHKDCKDVFFCQAEDQLIKKVSGRSGSKFERFRSDKKLMRTLKMINENNMKTCKPADDQVEIQLSEFLKNLKQCVQLRNANKIKE
nr:interleukin-13 [Misgurnus anguillicaudatus]